MSELNGSRSGSEYDVAIVGYGPVGQALAALLGRAGHRVLVVERHHEIYRLPRAAHIDHEVMRVLQALGVAGQLAEQMIPIADYQWFGADGELVISFSGASPAPSAWEPDYLFFQPEFEASLIDLARRHENIDVERGWSAEGISDTPDGVGLALRRVDASESRVVSASWLIGADGANSTVRHAAGIANRDLGFRERWLVVDVEPHDMHALSYLPVACQWCNPTRPTTHAQLGTRHHRWEFMLLPGEEREELEKPARVWDLLEPWFRPEDGTLTRRTVYEFRSIVAERMRAGHVLLVGDAAHLTPPFLGQGLCCGIRDAVNLAWKLDLVLRGLAEQRLLDTVELERQPQNETSIGMAIELGKIVCQADPEAAAARDAMLRQAPPPPPLALPSLTGGLLHRPSDGADPLAGTLSVQGTVACGESAPGRFDDLVGSGFQLIARSGDPLAGLSPEQLATLERLPVRVASLESEAPHGLRDADGRLTAWLEEHGVHAVLVRPDFYVFGSVTGADRLPALLDDLFTQLSLISIPLTAGALS